MECYTCPRELLPVIESALAAEGYVVESLIKRDDCSTCVTIMTCGADVVSLHENRVRDTADIHIHSSGASGRRTVREALPRLFPPILR